MACAWAGFAAYGVSMTLSYVVGQRINPISYPLRSIATYVVLALGLFALMQRYTAPMDTVPQLAINTLLVVAFAGHIAYWERRGKGK